MDISIKQISEGAPFTINFNKVVVERCHYINAAEERVEQTSILSNSTVYMHRGCINGSIYIEVYDGDIRINAPLTHFRVTTARYFKNEQMEATQTALIRGNEIIEELPITKGYFENGKISMFMLSKQNNQIVSFLLVNPQNTDNYYYRITFMATN